MAKILANTQARIPSKITVQVAAKSTCRHQMETLKPQCPILLVKIMVKIMVKMMVKIIKTMVESRVK
jgi:hypothetical protein